MADNPIPELFEACDKVFPFRACPDCTDENGDPLFLGSANTCHECGANSEASYREHQQTAFYQASKALFADDYDNVILDLPTGLGKSGINVGLGRLVEEYGGWLEKTFGIRLRNYSTFYTTPEKKLRNQLAADDDLSPFLTMLKGRADYTCGFSGKDCSTCEINNRSDRSCRNIGGCTYWGAKEGAMRSPIAAVTFAMLIYDNYVPPYTEEGEQISFTDRGLLIVDEGQDLEGQSASMFAGFSVTPWTVPEEVWGNTGHELDWDWDRYDDVSDILRGLYQRCQGYVRQHEGIEDPQIVSKVEKAEKFVQRYEYLMEEIGEGRDWVVNIDEVSQPGGGNTKGIELKPVDVDRFLKKFIWSRGGKRVISSATIPYRSDPDTWADRIGLEGDVRVIGKPMPFPKENRPIRTDTMIAKMSSGGDDENWGEIVTKVKQLAKGHKGEKGLIHTASYNRAERLYDSLKRSESVMLHERGEDAEGVVEEWEASDKDMLLSPAMTTGVDLYDDRCRWQVFLKVPYPMSGDSRTSFLLNERNDWQWMYETTSLHCVQAVGRGVRGPEDYCTFYVLDESWDDVMDRTSQPDWFLEAFTTEEATAPIPGW